MSNELPATGTAASSPSIDWREVARAALGSALVAGLIAGGFSTLAKLVEAEMQANAATDLDHDSEDDADEDRVESDVREAAAALGVSPDSTADEIRAALRARLGASRLHPDHGGDGEEAKRLIAAKNLLLERLRGRP